MTQKILLIEDDPDVTRVVRGCLEQASFAVVAAENGAKLDFLVKQHTIELAIVDLHLPGENGLSLVSRLKAMGSMGIIILTGHGEPIDRVVGLELGADDYITKPFEPRELVARVRAVLRRTSQVDGPASQFPTAKTFHWSGWTFDSGRQLLTAPDGTEVTLTGGEFRLLQMFLTHPNRILTRDQIVELVSSGDSPAFDRSIDVRIARLRKKLLNSDSRASFIRTIRYYGYQFSANVDSN